MFNSTSGWYYFVACSVTTFTYVYWQSCIDSLIQCLPNLKPYYYVVHNRSRIKFPFPPYYITLTSTF